MASITSNTITLDQLPAHIQEQLRQDNDLLLNQLTTALAGNLPTREGKTRRTKNGFFEKLFGTPTSLPQNPFSTLVVDEPPKANTYLITPFTLGKGAMGKVKLGINTQTGEWVAIKIIPQQAHIIANNLRNINFLKDSYLSSHQGKDNPKHYLILPFVPGTSLKKVLFQEGFIGLKNPLSLADKFNYAESLIEQIKFYHDQGYIISDLKPENCMLYNHKIRLVDLDDVRLNNTHALGLFTSGYRDIELYQTQQSDIFALAVILGDIFTPYSFRPLENSLEPGELRTHVQLYFNDDNPPMDSLERQVWDLCKQMLNPKAQQRPNITLIFNKIQEIKQRSEIIDLLKNNISDIKDIKTLLQVYTRLISQNEASPPQLMALQKQLVTILYLHAQQKLDHKGTVTAHDFQAAKQEIQASLSRDENKHLENLLPKADYNMSLTNPTLNFIEGLKPKNTEVDTYKVAPSNRS